MRRTRPRYSELSEEARRKSIARSYTNVLVRRGKLTRQGCEKCGGVAQAHHEDYGKPRDVRWLCREHHMAEHARV